MPRTRTQTGNIPPLPAFPDPTQAGPVSPGISPTGSFEQTLGSGGSMGFVRPAGSYNFSAGPTSALDIGINPEQLPGLPAPGSFGGERTEIQDSTMDLLMRSLLPVYDRQEEQLLQRLANQGVPQTSDAYGQEMDFFRRSLNESLEAAALQSLLAGSSEQERLFQQGLANRNQVAGEQLGLGGLQMQGLGIQANANIAGQQTAAQRAIADAQLALQGANDAWARDMQARQQYFNEMGFFMGSPGQPMLGMPQATPINVPGAYGAFNAGVGNQISGQLGQYNAGLDRYNIGTQAAGASTDALAGILGALIGLG